MAFTIDVVSLKTRPEVMGFIMPEEKKMPAKLRQEPIIEAIFEIRFASKVPASTVVPGFLYSALDIDGLEQLPTAQIPQELREANPQLKYAPISRLKWSDFFINVSDHSIAVSCGSPYPGWKAFKESMTTILVGLNQANFICAVERLSLKYIDLIESDDLKEQVGMLNASVELSGHKLKKEAAQLRMEIVEDDYIKVVQVVTGASVQLPDNEEKQGLITDIDVIVPTDDIGFGDFLKDIDEHLDKLHSVNKQGFFDCLTDETIERLEPEYD